jgi:hypothetical protein
MARITLMGGRSNRSDFGTEGNEGNEGPNDFDGHTQAKQVSHRDTEHTEVRSTRPYVISVPLCDTSDFDGFTQRRKERGDSIDGSETSEV